MHLVSANEKDVICEKLWLQHTEEMELIEKVTIEFQPNADQAWQHLAAKHKVHPIHLHMRMVHKSELSKTGCTIEMAQVILGSLHLAKQLKKIWKN